MQIETEQVVLTLTSDKGILSALRANKAFRTDKEGREHLVRQFNSQDFDFQTGSRITVGKTVAAALKRDTSFVMGDGLTGPLVCPLVEVSSFEAGKGVGNLSCPHCNKQFKNTPSLGHHLLRARSECPEYKGGEEEPEATEEKDHVDGSNEPAEAEELSEPANESTEPKGDPKPDAATPPHLRVRDPAFR